ncbi:MAG: flagellar biosynthesis anti-sigma factor FlgM [Spirochaetaceae bacterium]
MSIERLGPVDPIQKLNQSDKATKAERQEGRDTISFSEEARIKADMHRLEETVRSTSEVRMDRVEEVKRRLEDPSYIDERVLDSVADRIMDAFGL